jgi:hypothetical protein
MECIGFGANLDNLGFHNNQLLKVTVFDTPIIRNSDLHCKIGTIILAKNEFLGGISTNKT